ncbi:MAG: ABC transporter ATP-binding protein [Candidatus Hodarchaeales archaeon]|jgi:ABC-2 type transport system ATP-binding protein
MTVQTSVSIQDEVSSAEQVSDKLANNLTEPILRVEDLTKIYGFEITFAGRTFGRKVTGAENVSFSINKGEIFGFLGPNGAGKTTTIRAILGYLKIQNGRISIFGFDHLRDSMDIRKNIGYVPGDVSLYGNFTGLELIDYFNNFQPIDQDLLDELRSLFRVDLTLKIKALSSGNRQQVALIAAIASKPELLILDEPSSGLDPLMVDNFHKLLRKLQKNGITIFLSSHDLAEVQAICDRVAIIKEGKIIIVERVEDLKSKSLQMVTIQFKDKVPSARDIGALSTTLSVEKVNGYTFKLKIKEVDELIRFLINYELKRITIEDSSLHDIFLEYYK